MAVRGVAGLLFSESSICSLTIPAGETFQWHCVETSKPSVSSHSIEVSKVKGYYINKYRRGLNIRWDPTGTRARSKNMMEAFQYSLMNDDGDEKNSRNQTTIMASFYQEIILYGFPTT